MPVDALFFVQLPYRLDEARLEALRTQLYQDLELIPDDFWAQEGPLRLPEWLGDLPNYIEEHGTVREMTEADLNTFWLNVNIQRCYYGPGYERGYFPEFVRIAKWLEVHLLESQVWYGNDGSDTIRPFGPLEREAQLAYYNVVRNKPYDKRRAAAAAEYVHKRSFRVRLALFVIRCIRWVRGTLKRDNRHSQS